MSGTEKSLGQIAYEAWRSSGRQLHDWETMLDDFERARWEIVAGKIKERCAAACEAMKSYAEQDPCGSCADVIRALK